MMMMMLPMLPLHLLPPLMLLLMLLMLLLLLFLLLIFIALPIPLLTMLPQFVWFFVCLSVFVRCMCARVCVCLYLCDS